MTLVAAPAAAQPVRTIQGTEAAKVEAEISDAMIKGDPDRRICKQVTGLGSRLKKGKVCKTARQWYDEKSQDRKMLERIQTQRTVQN
jgi:hypothetical protein